MNTEIEKLFVNYEIAFRLKELGFNEPCFSWYGDGKFRNGKIPEKLYTYSKDIFDEDELKEKNLIVLAPLYQQAFRFFREKYGLINSISEQTVNTFGFYIDKLGDNKISQFREFTGFETYEEAELACLEELILIIKQK